MDVRWIVIPVVLALLVQFPPCRASNFQPVAELNFGTYMPDIVIDDARDLAYLSAHDLDSVLVLSLDDLQVIDEIPVGVGPMRMDMDPATDRLYVALDGGSGVAVIDLALRNLTATWPMSRGVVDVVVGRPGRIYTSGGGISAVNTSDGSVEWWRNDLDGVLAISPNHRYLYHGGLSSFPAGVDKWDVQTDTPAFLGSNRDTNSLLDMSLSPDGAHLYLAARGSIILDTGTMNATGSLPESEGCAVAVSPDGQRVILGGTSVYAYDSISGDELDSFVAPYGYPRAIRMDSLGQRVLISQTDYQQSDLNRLLVYSWVYATPPTIDILSPLPGSGTSRHNVTVCVHITDPRGVDVSSIKLSIDGSDLSIIWDPVRNYATSDSSGLNNGSHLLTAIASNLAGIGPRIVDWNFVVDQGAPWSSITSVRYASSIWSINVYAEGFDTLSTVRDIVLYYRKDGGSWVSRGAGGVVLGPGATRRWWSLPVNDTGGFGLYEFYTIATDIAGNQESKSPHAEASIRVSPPPDPVGDMMKLTLLVAILGIVCAIGATSLNLWRLRRAKAEAPDSPFSVSERVEKRRATAAATLTVCASPMHLASIVLSIYGMKVIAEAVAGRAITWREFMTALDQTGYLWLFFIFPVIQACFAIVAAAAALGFKTRRWTFAPFAIMSGAIAVAFSFAIFGGIVGAAAGALTIAGGIIIASRPSTEEPFPRVRPTAFPRIGARSEFRWTPDRKAELSRPEPEQDIDRKDSPPP